MRLFFLMLFCFAPSFSIAQDSIRYDADFQFFDGIYLSFNDFRNDNPIDFERVVSKYKVDDPTFLDEIFSAKSIVYFDRFNEQREISADRVWGFSHHGKPYVMLNAFSYVGAAGVLNARSSGKNEFGRFIVVGQISLIQVNMRVMSPISDLNQTGQYLLNMKTGEVKHYTLGNFEEFLEADEELHYKYSQLFTDKKKKAAFFQYIRKFNEKYPTYFPYYE